MQFTVPWFSAMRPASQAVHEELASVFANKPRVQLEHLLWPEAGWNCPIEHAEQFVAPFASEILPASQEVQETMPSLSANVPALQLEQVAAPELLYLPTWQMLQFTSKPVLKEPASQLVQEVAPRLVPVAKPAPQLSHADAPESLWYFPSPHGVQFLEPELGAIVPASHVMQLTVASADAKVPATQPTHSL